jgi:hypothetical protein
MREGKLKNYRGRERESSKIMDEERRNAKNFTGRERGSSNIIGEERGQSSNIT